jgi:hypothetical protein
MITSVWHVLTTALSLPHLSIIWKSLIKHTALHQHHRSLTPRITSPVMARSQTSRTREARQRLYQLRKIDIHIGVPRELRTLKRSARKQLERQSAPLLWIFPGDGEHHPGGSGVHPPASLLGLPTELRQTILYMCYGMDELECDVAVSRPEENKRTRRLEWINRMAPKVRDKMGKGMVAKFGLRSREGELVTFLSRKVGVLSCISIVTRQDMHYVKKQWEADLENHIDREPTFRMHTPKPKVIAPGYEWLYAPDLGPLAPKPKKSQVVRAKKLKVQKKVRPRKCWYCTERHFGDDPVCPLARCNPGKWKQLTKEVVNWRRKDNTKSTYGGAKVAFDA